MASPIGFQNTFINIIYNTDGKFWIIQKKTQIAHGDKKFSGLLPFHFYVLRRRQKEKRINPPNTSSGGPSSPASPPSMASPGGFFGAQPGGSTTPPTSLTPYSGSPGKNKNFSLYGSLKILFGSFWVLWGFLCEVLLNFSYVLEIIFTFKKQ